MLLEDRSYWSKISENSVFFPMRGRRSGKESVFKCLFFKTINVQFLRKIFQGMKIHLPYAIFNSSKMVFNSTPF